MNNNGGIKSSFLNNIKLWLALIVLLSLNLYLVTTNWYSDNVSSDQTTTSIPKKLVFSESYDNVFINKSLVRDDASLQLVVMFPKSYCPRSMEIEVPKISKLAKNYSGKITVLDIGMRYNLDNSIGEKINYVDVDSLNKYISITEKQVTVPIMLVVDRYGLVQLAYVSDATNPEKSEQFYKKVSSLFNSVYN